MVFKKGRKERVLKDSLSVCEQGIMSTPELRIILKDFCKDFNKAVENKTKYPACK